MVVLVVGLGKPSGDRVPCNADRMQWCTKDSVVQCRVGGGHCIASGALAACALCQEDFSIGRSESGHKAIEWRFTVGGVEGV